MIGPTPQMHVLAGPNGAGKTSLYEQVLKLQLPGMRFISADGIAAYKWPGEEQAHAYEASTAASEQRDAFMRDRRSMVTETVFSHLSKLDLIRRAIGAGYDTTLHVVMVPEDLAVLRVADRVKAGGHPVPEGKVRARYRRLRALVAAAVPVVGHAVMYDNSDSRRPHRVVARFDAGMLSNAPVWPAWSPSELRALG